MVHIWDNTNLNIKSVFTYLLIVAKSAEHGLQSTDADNDVKFTHL